MPAHPPHHPLRGAGLAQVLSTSDFAEWEAATSCTLGHHRSHLLDPDEGFEAHYRLGSAGPLQVLHIRGRGRVELERTQQARVVLWLPLLGSSQERLNSTPTGAEPGMALLFRPGDEMLGRTSEDMEGISVHIPESLLTESGPSLLERGPRAREAIAQRWRWPSPRPWVSPASSMVPWPWWRPCGSGSRNWATRPWRKRVACVCAC